MAPGPAISGVASGKTDGSGTVCGASVWPSRRLVRRSNSISSAVRNSRTPPATRKAGMEMPTKPMTASPNTVNSASRTSATQQARRPMARRSDVGAPCVSAAKSGVSPIGSIITKSVTKAVMRAVVSMSSIYTSRRSSAKSGPPGSVRRRSQPLSVRRRPSASNPAPAASSGRLAGSGTEGRVKLKVPAAYWPGMFVSALLPMVVPRVPP